MKNISFKDRLKILRGELIPRDSSFLEEILGNHVMLKEFSGAWEEEGIFVNGWEGYIFLSRHYSDPDQNGRGNIILAREISQEDIIYLTKEKEKYLIRFIKGGPTAVYDEGDLDAGLKEGYFVFDKLLSCSGISQIRRVN